MPGSDFQTLILPFLENLKEGEERSMNDINAELLRFVELTDEALKPFAPEKDEPAYQQAIVWAREHLTKAGLIENTREDYVRITSMGLWRFLNVSHFIWRGLPRSFPAYRFTCRNEM
jgi:restriction system protein